MRRTTALRVGLALMAAWTACSRPGSDAPQTAAAGLTLPAGAETAARAVDPRYIEGVIAHLSADSLAGRGPATAGDRSARRHLIQLLQESGCEPGAPGGVWEQPLDLVGITSHMPATWRFEHGSGDLGLAWWDEYIAGSGVQAETVAVDGAEIVFVGYGITAPEENWDDFKGTDLRGKVLLVLNNDPDWDPALFAGNRRLYYGRWDYKYENAARQGAVGAIIVHTPASAGYPWKVVQTSWTGEQFELPAGDEPRLQLAAWVTEAAARRLAALGGQDLDALVESARSRDFRPVPLGARTSLDFRNTLHRGSRTANVVGLLRGRDARLAAEFVIYTAHHDHLGVGAPDSSGDRIYNGARDNAAGTASVLAVARAFAALPARPRRSVLFLFVAAEEQGLLGSEWFAAHPAAPPGRIAANINIDGPNIFGRTRDVAVIGRGKSNLEDVLEAAAALQGRIVVDEPTPDKGYYYRSDQFNFAKIGVPALYFKAGTEYLGRPPGWGTRMEDAWRDSRYHQPSDVIDADWSFDGLVEDAQLAFYVGLAAAEADEPPAWKPGDEFEAVRARAVQELSSP